MLLEQEEIYREIYPHHSSGRVQSNALKSRADTVRVIESISQLSYFPMTTWQSLLLLYRSIDVCLPDCGPKSDRFVYTMSDDEIQDAIDSFRQFPQLVNNLTSGQAGIKYQITTVENPLGKLTRMTNGSYWPSPDSTRTEIDQLAPPGRYDSIFILWPQHNYKRRESIRSGGWGLAIPASPWSNQATYASIANAERWQWQVPIVGEVWLHEWLHGVCAYFANLGYVMPAGDADGGGRHGYVQSPLFGWTTYYRDLMTGNVLESGNRTGIPIEVWKHKPEIEVG
jgi:hypothetical protein